MAGFTVRQLGPRSGNQGTILEFEVLKPSHNKVEVIVNNGPTIMSVETDPTTGVATYLFDPNIVQQANLNVQAEPQTKGKKKAAKKPKNDKPNWRVDGSTLLIKPHPDAPDETTIELPILSSPAPHSPQWPVPNIVGQPEMLFTICLGMAKDKPSMLIGPTGVGKTTAPYFLAKLLGWNVFRQPIAKGTEAYHLIGEMAPDLKGHFSWVDGITSAAVRASQDAPTILILDELNRIGNIAELSCIYPLLDDTRMLELPQTGEVLKAGQLCIVATSNPSDGDDISYIGTQELDPALNSRFPFQPSINYPEPAIEAAALCARVPDLASETAVQMVEIANRIRAAENIPYPISFRELEAWALSLPYFDYVGAAEVAVISKAPYDCRDDIRAIFALQGNK